MIIPRRTLAGRPSPAPADWTLIGLGGNLGDEATIAERFAGAIARLEALCEVPARRSPLYRSAARGPVAAQPPFVNAVVALPWQPEVPAQLLATLFAIEAEHGRMRSVAQGPRTLDLDLLLVGTQRVERLGLILPHLRLGERAFVLQPLADLLGAGFVLPDGVTIADRLTQPTVAGQSIARLD